MVERIERDGLQALHSAGELALHARGDLDNNQLAFLLLQMRELKNAIEAHYEAIVTRYCERTAEVDPDELGVVQDGDVRQRLIRVQAERTTVPDPGALRDALIDAGVAADVVANIVTTKDVVNTGALTDAIMRQVVGADEVMPFVKITQTKPYVRWEEVRS